MKTDPRLSIPNKSSTGADWIEWHKSLESNFGNKIANMLWLKAWNRFGGKGSDASTVDLRNYMSKQGVNVDTTTFESIQDKGSDISDFFGDFFAIGKWVGIGLAVIVVGGVAMIVYNIGKNPNAAIGATSEGLARGMKGGI